MFWRWLFCLLEACVEKCKDCTVWKTNVQRTFCPNFVLTRWTVIMNEFFVVMWLNWIWTNICVSFAVQYICGYWKQTTERRHKLGKRSQPLFSWRRAEYTVQNVETTTALFRANTSYMVCTCKFTSDSYFLFKTQHGRIPMDPAILAAIGHCFIAKQKKIKNTDARLWGDAHGDQKSETFFGP